MSLWLHKKDSSGRPHTYSIGLPLEPFLVIAILGIAFQLLLSTPSLPHAIQLPAIGLLALGFVLFLAAKISLFRRGIWTSFGTRHLTGKAKPAYIAGYALMAIGLLLLLLAT